jgi:hypothetical protein
MAASCPLVTLSSYYQIVSQYRPLPLSPDWQLPQLNKLLTSTVFTEVDELLRCGKSIPPTSMIKYVRVLHDIVELCRTHR